METTLLSFFFVQVHVDFFFSFTIAHRYCGKNAVWFFTYLFCVFMITPLRLLHRSVDNFLSSTGEDSKKATWVPVSFAICFRMEHCFIYLFILIFMMLLVLPVYLFFCSFFLTVAAMYYLLLRFV